MIMVFLSVIDSLDNSTFSWTLNNAVINEGLSFSNNPTYDETYTVNRLDTITGCVGSSTGKISVINKFNFPFNNPWDTTIVVGDFATLPIVYDSIYYFNWSLEDEEASLSCYQCSYPKIQRIEETNISLFVEDVRDCHETTIDFNIKIHPETFIKMPTTFSPNGDGNNDILYIRGWGAKELKFFQIYDRWGELLFETDDYEQGWDGLHKGKLQNNDVYVYKIKLITWRDEELFEEGYINLMR